MPNYLFGSQGLQPSVPSLVFSPLRPLTRILSYVVRNHRRVCACTSVPSYLCAEFHFLPSQPSPKNITTTSPLLRMAFTSPGAITSPRTASSSKPRPPGTAGTAAYVQLRRKKLLKTPVVRLFPPSPVRAQRPRLLPAPLESHGMPSLTPSLSLPLAQLLLLPQHPTPLFMLTVRIALARGFAKSVLRA